MAAIEPARGAVELAEAPEPGPAGDADGFPRFARAQRHRLVQFLRMHTPTLQDAEDAAQESIIRLMRYRYSAPASDWMRLLYRIAINTAHDRFRAARRQRAMVEAVLAEPDPAEPDQGPDEYAAREQLLARIRNAILGLPPKCRNVCVLRLARDMTNAQIADACGISTKMVDPRIAIDLRRA